MTHTVGEGERILVGDVVVVKAAPTGGWLTRKKSSLLERQRRFPARGLKKTSCAECVEFPIPP
jgi:hypothetical protein